MHFILIFIINETSFILINREYLFRYTLHRVLNKSGILGTPNVSFLYSEKFPVQFIWICKIYTIK